MVSIVDTPRGHKRWMMDTLIIHVWASNPCNQTLLLVCNKMHVRFTNTYVDCRPRVPPGNNRIWVRLIQWTHHPRFVNTYRHMGFTFTLYYTLTTSAKFWLLQTKGTAMKNVAHLMNIHIDSSSNDSDFVQPPPKRNRGLEQQPSNIPQQPQRPSMTHTERVPGMKKIVKVSPLL
jgi:hypothetical protein